MLGLRGRMSVQFFEVVMDAGSFPHLQVPASIQCEAGIDKKALRDFLCVWMRVLAVCWGLVRPYCYRVEGLPR
jgi:hypothetical protein